MHELLVSFYCTSSAVFGAIKAHDRKAKVLEISNKVETPLSKKIVAEHWIWRFGLRFGQVRWNEDIKSGSNISRGKQHGNECWVGGVWTTFVCRQCGMFLRSQTVGRRKHCWIVTHSRTYTHAGFASNIRRFETSLDFIFSLDLNIPDEWNWWSLRLTQ